MSHGVELKVEKYIIKNTFLMHSRKILHYKMQKATFFYFICTTYISVMR